MGIQFHQLPAFHLFRLLLAPFALISDLQPPPIPPASQARYADLTFSLPQLPPLYPQARYADLTFSRLPDGSASMRTRRAQAEADAAWEAASAKVS